jgi:hypothetical protein
LVTVSAVADKAARCFRQASGATLDVWIVYAVLFTFRQKSFFACRHPRALTFGFSSATRESNETVYRPHP